MLSFFRKLLCALARMGSIAAVVFFSVSFTYLFVENRIDMRNTYALVLIGLFIVAVIGCLISFPYPKMGSSLLMFSGLMMGAYLIVRGNFGSAQVYSLPFLLPGLLLWLSTPAAEH